MDRTGDSQGEHNTVIGLIVAFCTAASYYPRLQKCWRSSSTGGLSLGMFSILAAGAAFCIVYGDFQADLVNVRSF